MKVYQAINKVQAALAAEGIAKNRRNQQQGYAFRGIDDIYGALARLLAENGLCILPRVCSRSTEERESRGGGVLIYTVLDMEFDIVCSEDGSKHTVRTIGEAMDSGDKSSNKAMSAAFKYACLQSFCIPTEGDNDADSSTHEVKAKPERPGKVWLESLKLTTAQKEAVKNLCNERGLKVFDVAEVAMETVKDYDGLMEFIGGAK